MVRYAVLFNRSPSEIARWSSRDLDLLDQFLDKEPHPLDRIEQIMARLTAMFFNVHKERQGMPMKSIDLTPHKTAWPSPLADRYSDVDQEVLAEF